MYLARSGGGGEGCYHLRHPLWELSILSWLEVRLDGRFQASPPCRFSRGGEAGGERVTIGLMPDKTGG